MDEMSLVTIHPKRIRWMKNPWDVVSGFKHDNRLKCQGGIVSQWTFQVGLNVTVDETWVVASFADCIKPQLTAGLLNIPPDY